MDDNHKAITIWLSVLSPPTIVLCYFRQELLQERYIFGLLINPTKRKRKHWHLRDIRSLWVGVHESIEHLILQTFLAPENHLWDLPIGLLHLQHRAEILYRIVRVDSRPSNHMEARIPKPLIRPVLDEPRPIEMVIHAPFATVDKVTTQSFRDVADKLLVSHC